MVDVIVGIDLGTTGYSVHMYSPDGSSEPLLDFDELDRTPCYVAHFVHNFEKLVGLQAKQMENRHKRSVVVYEPKRLIGRQFSDKKLQALIPLLSYPVQDDGDNHWEVVVKRGIEIVRATPNSTYVLLFANIKDTIEEYIKTHCTINVVITVPSTFTTEQRNATFLPAEYVGLHVLDLFEETKAIAKSYFSKYESLEKGEYFLVYDLGAGDFKISIWKVTDDDFAIVSNCNHTGLSGQDFDLLLLDYITKSLKKVYKSNFDLDKRSIRYLLNESEKARINLSENTISSIVLKNIPPSIETVFEISRADFEKIASKLLERTVSIVDQFINNSKVNKRLIKKIILYGGLSRTPKIQQLLFARFGHIISEELVDENTSVANGAALLAAQLFAMHQDVKFSQGEN